MQVTVGNLFVFARVVAFPDDRDLIATGFQVAVKAVVGGVQFAVFVPFDIDSVRIKRGVFNLGVWLEPVQALALLAPEGFRVVDRLLIHRLIFVVIGMRLGSKSRIDRIYVLFTHRDALSLRFVFITWNAALIYSRYCRRDRVD